MIFDRPTGTAHRTRRALGEVAGHPLGPRHDAGIGRSVLERIAEHPTETSKQQRDRVQVYVVESYPGPPTRQDDER